MYSKVGPISVTHTVPAIFILCSAISPNLTCYIMSRVHIINRQSTVPPLHSSLIKTKSSFTEKKTWKICFTVLCYVIVVLVFSSYVTTLKSLFNNLHVHGLFFFEIFFLLTYPYPYQRLYIYLFSEKIYICTHTLGCIMFGPFWSICCKTALAEVGVSLPWWCLAPVLLAPGYWRVFFNLIIFS